ncbi:MAG: hypothetical protein ACKO38_11360 [Planctomycetota bacterium]
MGSAQAGSGQASSGHGVVGWLIDIALALFLGGVLLAVFAVDAVLARLSPKTPAGSTLVESAAPVAAPSVAKRLRLAVTPHKYDDMGRLLNDLGDGYRYDMLRVEDFDKIDELRKYDVVFATCGETPDTWKTASGEGFDAFRRALRTYVEEGGTLYASDWRMQLLMLAFPELIDQEKLKPGDAQEMTAQVVDDGLREVIGPDIHLKFDLPNWYPAAFRGREVKTFLRGTYAAQGSRVDSPLLVRIPVGRGSIVFTSFHNEKQNSRTELELLKYLVFATVTARVQTEVAETMLQGGFSSAKQNLLSASAGAPTASSTYKNAAVGALKFVLAFENQGAKLRIEVVGPDGSKHVREGIETIQLDIPSAPAGDYRYTVTALQVPFENFPFTVTVGRK